jgi:glutaconyl-CoA decarboxylase
MHGETAAAATFSRRLVKEKDAGRPLEPIIENMNKMVKEYYDNSRPAYCAKHGLVDEIVNMTDIRKYLVAFAGAAYQNPKSICPHHHLMLPRIIKG